METPNIEEELSDDEIYFGKITIKEIKKMFCSRQGASKTCDVGSKNDLSSSLRLIETHSQPNLRSHAADSPVFSSQLVSPARDRMSDQSFIQMENMVSKLCVSPRNSDNVELNNTLEVIDYILNHGPNHNNAQDPVRKHDIKEEDKARLKECLPIKLSPQKYTPVKESLKIIKKTDEVSSPSYYTPQDPVRKHDIKNENEASLKACLPIKLCPEKYTPVKDSLKIIEKTNKMGSPSNTPAKSVLKKLPNEFVTPSSNSVKSKTPIFKTPAYPSTKKPSTPRFTPSRTNSYQHITSPIASYIKNCPQAPLVKDVHPKKPLPGASSIPKFVRNPSQTKIQLNKNKENINLPSIAYKSAKKTKVIQLPDENRLPQSQWVKKITSSFPKPTVMKHENRETNPVKKPLLSNQEDSFANLSCQQAEVSLCTQKSAFKSTNKY